MGVTILHPGLKLGVFVTWRDVSTMTGDTILQEIEKYYSPTKTSELMMDR